MDCSTGIEKIWTAFSAIQDLYDLPDTATPREQAEAVLAFCKIKLALRSQCLPLLREAIQHLAITEDELGFEALPLRSQKKSRKVRPIDTDEVANRPPKLEVPSRERLVYEARSLAHDMGYTDVELGISRASSHQS